MSGGGQEQFWRFVLYVGILSFPEMCSPVYE